MHPGVQEELMKFLNLEVRPKSIDSENSDAWVSDTASSNTHVGYDWKPLLKLLPQNPQKEMMFIIKNYNAGLTQHMFSNDQSLRYEVKGPLGESLGVEQEGLHIAFTAGTGVLPLMDLVGHILFKKIGLNEKLGVRKEDEIGKTFRFKLYVSFRGRDEQVALDFLESIWSYFRKYENP